MFVRYTYPTLMKEKQFILKFSLRRCRICLLISIFVWELKLCLFPFFSAILAKGNPQRETQIWSQTPFRVESLKINKKGILTVLTLLLFHQPFSRVYITVFKVRHHT